MEPHISGDDNTQESTQVSGVLASKTFLRTPTASPSGDFQNTTHQFVTLVSEGTSEENEPSSSNFDILKQVCEFGDSWVQKYPVPLSKYPQRPIRTGNLFYDGIIVDLELLGYRPLQIVAKARSGTVILAQNLHMLQHFQECETVPVALKLNSGKPRRNRPPSKTNMLDEMTIHRQLNHPNIVSWISNISYRGRVGTVMEFCENGTLEQVVKLQEARFLPETVARRYFKQIHSAIDYIHQEGFAHRDICPQNVLITQNNNVKICDFGHSVKFVSLDHLCEDECGSIGYQAPQMLEKVPYNPKVADVWSLGAMLYTICVGRLPLGTIRNDILENASKELKFPDSKILYVSQDLKWLLKGMLAYKPDMRFSMNRICHSLWICTEDKQVKIGNFYRVRQPQKSNEGTLETHVKEKLKI
ncbi:hypothetical protein ACF0H5_021081 [Mactra antiquata]